MERLSTQASEANIQKALEMLRNVPGKLEALGRRLTAVELDRPSAPGEWSPRRILVHLVNCEARAADGIYPPLLTDNPPFHNIHAERDFGKLMRFEQYSYAELLAYFAFRRRMMLSVLEGLTPEQWRRVYQPESRKRQETVYNMARGCAIHESEHLLDLEEKLGLSL